jgi:oligoribonuclease (3'-5' exoribonuclease)
MVDLTINVEALKGKLADYAGDELLGRGSANCVLNLDIEKVMFKEQDIDNKEEKLNTVKANLAIARKNSMDWLNNIEPELTNIPQGFINYASYFATVIPQIRQELENETPQSRGILKKIFSGLSDQADIQKKTLDALKTSILATAKKIKTDSLNFSDSNQVFADLEAQDEKNLKTAKQVVQNLSELIDKHNRDITAKMIKEEEDLTIADIVISAGGVLGHLGEPIEALGLAIGLVFIVCAGMLISDLQAEIEEEFREAQEEEEYKLIITQLTEQLLALHAASSSLKSMTETIDSLDTSIQGILGHWDSIQTTNQSAITALDDDSQPINDIIGEFNLGRASAEWEEANNFAVKMQALPISRMSQKLKTIPPKKNT